MTIWAEARAEQIEGEVAVGCVLRNRVLRPSRFGDTFGRVCFAPAQFSCWNPGSDKNHIALVARCLESLSGAKPWPTQQMWIAEGIISGAIEDRVAGADHYHATYIKEPRWAKDMKFIEIIGLHRFLKE